MEVGRAAQRIVVHGSASAQTEPNGSHAQEHSLEVHLPFLQRLLGAFTVLPLVCGRADADTVADVMALVWGGPETLIVVSTDLSHYHDHMPARGPRRPCSTAWSAGCRRRCCCTLWRWRRAGDRRTAA